MKKLILLFCLVPLVLSAQIKFESSWKEALSKSRMTGKLIFLDAYAEWCEPCKEMEAYTFTDLEVANYYNANFINVHLDMEGYPGVELAEDYSVGVFPSFLFINGNGEVVHRGCGAMDASQFLNLGEDALIDSLTLQSMEIRFDKGERSADFLIGYLELLEDACLDAERFAAGYLKNIELTKLKEETPWEVFAAYQWDIYSREFQYLLNNREVFEASIGQRIVNAKLYDTYLSQYQEVFEAEELHDYGMRALLHSFKDVSFTGADTLRLMMNLHYAEFKENWDEYAAHAVELVGMTEMSDAEQLNELAWKFYLFVENKNQLEIASSWAQQAVDKQPEPSIIDTYASLQFKLGNKKKAIELEKRALELAKELYDDISHYEYQLKKFEGN
ncbi:thioredoxin fold domain-containing protein [Ekhidna sp. To15]|uniref:thioredoxin family protein n=1 Tax=Ekhidna sp. To15 TaxID=3395267 RepID=UPI003F522F3E